MDEEDSGAVVAMAAVVIHLVEDIVVEATGVAVEATPRTR